MAYTRGRTSAYQRRLRVYDNGRASARNTRKMGYDNRVPALHLPYDSGNATFLAEMQPARKNSGARKAPRTGGGIFSTFCKRGLRENSYRKSRRLYVKALQKAYADYRAVFLCGKHRGQRELRYKEDLPLVKGFTEAEAYKQSSAPRSVWQIYGEMRQGKGNLLVNESKRGKSKRAGKETLQNIYGSGKGYG